MAVDPKTLRRYRANPAAFVEECLINETGKPFVLLPAERAFLKHALQIGRDGRLRYSQLTYSCPKKGGKTTFAGIFVVTIVVLFGERYCEAYTAANDLEQSVGRVFETCRRLVEASPLLKGEAKVQSDRILFPATGATIIALSSNYASAAGAHPTVAVFDELWGYTSERSRRMWDELVPVPSRKISCRLITSHAGFSGESSLLEEIYQRGLTLPRIGTDLYAGAGTLMFWSHTPIAPWQDERWLAEMARSLRPNQYQRMVENKFVRGETATFVPIEAVEACTDFGVYERPPQPGIAYVAFVDPASGTGTDSFTLVIAHQHSDQVVSLDLVRERRPPFVPADVIAEFAQILRSYGIYEIQGDNFAAGFHIDEWARHGIIFIACENTASVNYLHLLPRLLAKTVKLIDTSVGREQLAALERHVTVSREIIRHGTNLHDDVAAAIAGAVVVAAAMPAPLWQPDQFLVAPTPAVKAQMVYVVLLADMRRCQAVYFAKPRVLGTEPLLIVDVDVAPLGLGIFAAVVARLSDLMQQVGAWGGILFTSSALLRELERRVVLAPNMRAENIDVLLAEDANLLMLSAATHVCSGRVQLSAEARAKSSQIAGGLLSPTAHEGSPMQLTVLLGIALGLDEHRSLTKPRVHA